MKTAPIKLRLVPPVDYQVAPDPGRYVAVTHKIETVVRCLLSVIAWSILGFALTLVW